MTISSVLRVLLVIANLIFTSIVFHSDFGTNYSKCDKQKISTAKTYNILIWIILLLSFLIFDYIVIRSIKIDEVNEDNATNNENNENINNTNESEV